MTRPKGRVSSITLLHLVTTGDDVPVAVDLALGILRLQIPAACECGEFISLLGADLLVEPAQAGG